MEIYQRSPDAGEIGSAHLVAVDIVCTIQIGSTKGQRPEEEWESVPRYADRISRITASVFPIPRRMKMSSSGVKKGDSAEPISEDTSSGSTTGGPPRKDARRDGRYRPSTVPIHRRRFLSHRKVAGTLWRLFPGRRAAGAGFAALVLSSSFAPSESLGYAGDVDHGYRGKWGGWE